MPKNQHTQRKLLNLRIGLVGRCQKVAKFYFQSQFSIVGAIVIQEDSQVIPPKAQEGWDLSSNVQ